MGGAPSQLDEIQEKVKLGSELVAVKFSEDKLYPLALP
jgi:hypothetical protein